MGAVFARQPCVVLPTLRRDGTKKGRFLMQEQVSPPLSGLLGAYAGLEIRAKRIFPLHNKKQAEEKRGRIQINTAQLPPPIQSFPSGGFFYSFFHSGFRFSIKAVKPSLASWVSMSGPRYNSSISFSEPPKPGTDRPSRIARFVSLITAALRSR